VGGLQHLRAKGNDVIVFHVLDHAELTFPFERIADFEDSETHVIQKAVPQRVRETYLREIEQFCDFYKEKCRAGGMDYCRLNTSEPLNSALASYLSKRARSF
jgi:helix-turn-helix protein